LARDFLLALHPGSGIPHDPFFCHGNGLNLLPLT
jgi:hypothetical protein